MYEQFAGKGERAVESVEVKKIILTGVKNTDTSVFIPQLTIERTDSSPG